MRSTAWTWKAVWGCLRIIALPAGITVMVIAQLYGGMVDGVVISCEGFGKAAHCRWASVSQEPLYVAFVVQTWWCLFAISLLSCYLTYYRAVSRSTKRQSQ